MELSFREDVRSGAQEGVMGRVSSAERMKTNRVRTQTEIAADQTMRPQRSTSKLRPRRPTAPRSEVRRMSAKDGQADHTWPRVTGSNETRPRILWVLGTAPLGSSLRH